MNNEPVAWMMKAREPSLHSPDYITFETPTRDMKVSHHPHPLYTHPAKEPTNEEISDIRDQFFAPDGCNIYTFARALLKKAQGND